MPTHILKLPLGLIGGMKLDMRHSVENEWLCALILKEFGLPVAACQSMQFEDTKALVVERFDRTWWTHPEGGQRLVRLPQEDMCQAMGIAPEAKYEADGGPGIDGILDLLDGSITREQDRRDFFKVQLLFWMLCATDGHGKNFSLFLRPGGRYQLTPLYDVLSAYPVLGEGPSRMSPHRVKLAMAVRSRNAHWKVRDILRRAYGTHFSKGFFHYRLLSIGIITGAVVLMLLSFSMQVLIVGIEQFVTRVLPERFQSVGVVAISRGVSGFGLFLAIYMLFYSLTPSKYRQLKCPKWPGALFTTLWWIGVTLALPPLLASLLSYDATYGSLAGVMVALFFFYLVGLGMVMGAELNAALVEVEDLGHDAIGRVDDVIIEKTGDTK